MGNIQECPICLKKHELYSNKDEFGYWEYYYCNGKKFTSVIHESVFYNCSNEEIERRYNVIYNFVFDKPYSRDRYYWKFVYEENEEDFAKHIKENGLNNYINVYQLMKNYPKNLDEKIDQILLNLEKLNPALGAWFNKVHLRQEPLRIFYVESNNQMQEFEGILKYLEELKYIAWVTIIEFSCQFHLTHKARQRIEELKAKKETSKNIFIAMSFDKSIEYIETAFKAAIKESGYNPIIIKDKEHNNYIMPEIFHEIENALGVVVDVTKENVGAYFEAGYALGKKKEVIVCCKEEIFKDPEKKPHFDIAQKSMIIWKDEKDLIERLKSRINATIK